MVTKRILLRDLLTRLAQSDEKEIYVDIEELEPDVFVLPLSFVYSGVQDVLPDALRMVQSGGLLDAQENNAIPGNDSVVVGLVGETWELRSISLTSAAGGNYAVLDDAVQVAAVVAVALGATGELLEGVVGIPVAGASAITVLTGLLADSWNLRAVRIL